MEAGYDYLLIRRRLRKRFYNSSGFFVVALGVMLLAASGAYYGYAAVAKGNLPELNASAQPNPATPLDQGGMDSSLPAGRLGTLVEDGLPGDAPGSTASVSPAPFTFPASAISSQRLYPGDGINPGSWSYPASYEPLSYREELLLQGFTPLAIGEPFQDQAPATRLIIPSIGVDSSVKELSIIDLAGSRSYETPANTVGHIPATADAGEGNSAWFFGHTESPISNEGSVFYNLTKIPGKLQNGEDVFIITENAQGRFLYRVTSTRVMHQSELKLFDTGQSTIHLVSCVPRLVYDHRLVINGELVAKD